MSKSLDPVEGTPAPLDIFNHLDEIEVLDWYDGPLLVEHRHHDGRRFWRSWFDVDETRKKHRWLLFTVSDAHRDAYDRDEISFREIMRVAEEMYVADSDGSGDVVSLVRTTFDKLPATGLPTEDSFKNRDV